jgi:hypothetical protein
VLASLVPDGEALDDDEPAALAAPAEPQLIAPRQALREEHGVFERDHGRGDQGGIRLERGAERIAAADIRQRRGGGG